MDQDNLSSDALADGAHVDSAAAAGTVDSGSLTLDELNKALGKDFKDKDSALKAFKDTFSYVGKRKEDIEAEVRAKIMPSPQSSDDSELKSTVRRLEHDLFFTKNPQYGDMRSVIEKMGSDPAEVVNSPEFKAVFEKVQVANEAESKKSVVSSSPRLAQSKSDMEEAVKIANSRASGTDLAEHLAGSILKEIGG